MRGDCSASRLKRNPPCRVAMGWAHQRNKQRRRGRRTKCKCRKRCGEVRRQLWVKCGETWMSWNDFKESHRLQSNNLEPRAHNEKSCVGHVKDARGAVCCLHLAYKGFAIACRRNSLKKSCGSIFNAKENKLVLPFLWRPPGWRGGRRLRPLFPSPTLPLLF